MQYSNERLGSLLVEKGVISAEQLDVALERQTREGGKLGEVLTRELFASEDDIARVLATQKGYEHVSLASYDIDAAVTTLLPLRMLRKRRMIPIGIEGSVLVLAMADPLDIEAIDETELITGYQVQPVVAPGSQIDFAIEKYVAAVDVRQELELVTNESASQPVSSQELTGDDAVVIVRVVNQLLREAALLSASDIHFEPEDETIRVRFRVDGVLREVTSIPKTAQAELLSRVKVMADMDITERRRPQDGRIAIKVDGRRIDLRVATLPTPLGEAITLRLLDKDSSLHTLAETGLSAAEQAVVLRLLSKPYGSLLIAGPTGSGKSTTLYAMMNAINDPARKIITVEDPIEYRMPGLTQMAVNSRVGLTFAAGLRTILRSDPDIVMVGEVRDAETAEIAIRAALTGHLVLTSIHTNDAPSALTRLSDMGVPPYITAAGLLGAVAQRLLRRLCPACKQPVTYPTTRLVEAGFDAATLPTLQFFGPVGCNQCGGTGYKGRVGVFEIMEFNEALQTLFLKEAPAQLLKEVAVNSGMVTLRQSALRKAAEGITSLEEVDRAVV